MIQDAVFDGFTAKLQSMAGIVMTKDKSYLLESRLTPIASEFDVEGVEALMQKFVAAPNTDPVVNAVVDAMTTNETLFFRDTRPFDIFKAACIPHFLEARKTEKKLRIWSAASSTGQEAYSLCMILKEMGPQFDGWTIEMLGTDLSDSALRKAQEAKYTQFEVQRGMPIQMLMKYFDQQGDSWLLKDDIKNMVKFKKFNLLDDPTLFGKFDVIMLRNVLIYFDVPTKQAILQRMRRQVRSDGFLFLGGAETVIGLTNAFTAHEEHRGLYIPGEEAVAGSIPSAPRAVPAPPREATSEPENTTPAANTPTSISSS